MAARRGKRPTRRTRRSAGPTTTHSGRPSSTRIASRYRRPKVTFKVEPALARVYLSKPDPINRCIEKHFKNIRILEVWKQWGKPSSGTYFTECKVAGREFIVKTNLATGRTDIGFNVELFGR